MQSSASNILFLSDIYCILLDICCILLDIWIMILSDICLILSDTCLILSYTLTSTYPIRYLSHSVRYITVMSNPTRYLLHPIKLPAHTRQYYLSFEILKLSVVYWFLQMVWISTYITYCTYFIPYFSKITVCFRKSIYLNKNEIQMHKKVTRNLQKT